MNITFWPYERKQQIWTENSKTKIIEKENIVEGKKGELAAQNKNPEHCHSSPLQSLFSSWSFISSCRF